MLLTPVPEYQLCARMMNDYHLALSLGVIKSIWQGIKYPKTWSSSNSVALWKDNVGQLLIYGMFLVKEAAARRLPDTRDHSWIRAELNHLACDPWASAPWWLGNDEWHSCHRGIMWGKDRVFYATLYNKLGLGINFGRKYLDDPMAIFTCGHAVNERANLTNKASYIKAGL